MAHLNHLLLVSHRFDAHVHGLRQEDLTREDRQNWASAQRLFFPRVQDCLFRIENGDGDVKPEDMKGTRVYLEMGFKYVEIFCSFTATLLQRIEYASYVNKGLCPPSKCHAIKIWE